MGSDIQVTLNELYTGVTKEYNISKNVLCSHCKGTGDKDGKLNRCPKCRGKGAIMKNVQMGIGFTMQMQDTCDRCGGKGKIGGGNCPVCRGRKVEKKTETVRVEV